MNTCAITLSCFFALSLLSSPCSALPWKALHEEARTISVAEIQALRVNDPNNADRVYVAGLVYLYAYDHEKAHAAFLKVLELDPHAYEARWGLCEIMRRQHKLKESETELDKLTKEHPDFSPAFITLGFTKYLMLEFYDCIDYAEHVIAQGKDTVDIENYVRAHLMITAACGMLTYHGNPFKKMVYGPRALRHLKIAEKILPDAAGTLFAQGTFCLLAPRFFGRDLDKAEYLLRESIDKDPHFVDAYVRLAQVYKMKANEDKYEEYLRIASLKDPENELLLDIQSGRCNFICIPDA